MYQLIKLSFGYSTYKIFKRITCISKKIVKLRCRINFLNKCKSFNIIPSSFKVKALVNSKKGNLIATQSSRKFLFAAISLNHNLIKSLKISLHFNIVQMNSIIPFCYLSLIYKFLKSQVYTVESMLTCKLNEKFNRLCNSLKSNNSLNSNAPEIKSIQNQPNCSTNKVINLSSAPLLPSDVYIHIYMCVYIYKNTGNLLCQILLQEITFELHYIFNILRTISD